MTNRVAPPTSAEIASNLRTFSARLLIHSLLASEALGLAPMDLVCMCLLQLHGPVAPGWLAARTGLTTGAVTGVVDRLERAGYVTRRPDPQDRRRIIVEPDLSRFTKDLDRATPTRSPVTLDFLTDYSTGQLRTIRRFFADLADASSPPPKPA